MTDCATCAGTEYTVVACQVTCHTADDRTLQATCCVYRHPGHRDPQSTDNQCHHDNPTHDASFRKGVTRRPLMTTQQWSNGLTGGAWRRLSVREDQEAGGQTE